MGWVVVAGLWGLTGVVYIVLRFVESRKQVDRMINWTLPTEVKEEEP